MELQKSIAIILVNWESYAYTKACLLSLSNCSKSSFDIVVIDNGSKDGSGKKLAEEFQTSCTFIFSEENLGFTGGNNLGLKWALQKNYEFVLLLNNDTEVEPDFLEEMLKHFSEMPQVGIVQPLILFHHNPKMIWSAGGQWMPSLGRATTLGDRKLAKNFQIKQRSLDWATGCCMLISREALLKTGLLADQYFAYFEDVDWSLRFKDAGFEICLADQAIIYHVAGASSNKESSEGTLSPRVFYYNVRNQFYLIRSRVPGLAKFSAIAYHSIRFTMWLGYFALRGRRRKLLAVIRGFRDGLTQPLQPAPRWP